MNDCHALPTPLFTAFETLGSERTFAEHLETGALTWSLIRLFGVYHRVMTVLPLPRTSRPFLDADLEHFVIRFRIVLNDVAFLIWQLFPRNTRGMKNPKGPSHPKNKEMSVFEITTFLAKERSAYPELAAAFEEATPWMTRLRNERDNIVHYKSKAVIFDFGTPEFAFMDAASTEPRLVHPDGSSRIVTYPVGEFVNSQMMELHAFLHAKLAAAILAQRARFGLPPPLPGLAHQLRCTGIETFRRENGIGA